MATRFTEIRNDYYDESSNFYTIDAWEGDEEGKVVAVVNGTTGDVWFIDNTCRNDDGILEAIRNVHARLMRAIKNSHARFLNKKVISLEKAEGMLEGMLMAMEPNDIHEAEVNECVAEIHKKYIVEGFDIEGLNDEDEAWYDDLRADYI